MWTAVLGMLIGAATQAGEVVSPTRRVSVAIYAGDGSEDDVLVTSPMSGPWPLPMQASSDLLSFRNGHLWAAYCGSSSCASVPMAVDDPPLAFAKCSNHPRRACCRQWSSPLERLGGLLGWRPSPGYHAARHAPMNYPESASVTPVDDLPPTPPALLDSLESRERANAVPRIAPPSIVTPSADPEVAPAPMDLVPMDLVPMDLVPMDLVPMDPATMDPATMDPATIVPVSPETGSTDGSDGVPGDMELSPAAGDDPAPEPEPESEVPRNVLPKPRSTSGESASGTNGRKVLASRLSDFIRTH